MITVVSPTWNLYRVPILLSACTAAVLFIGTAYAIRNGIDTNEHEKTIMAWLKDSENSNSGSTVQNIWEPRCILTAGHVATEEGPDTWIFQGQHTNQPGKWQRIESRAILTDGNVYQDLAVLWLKNEDQVPGDGKPRIREGDYIPWAYGGVYPTPGSGTIMGYGENALVSGRGHKRKGFATVAALIYGTSSGAYYRITPNPTWQLACKGDSGGPLYGGPLSPNGNNITRAVASRSLPNSIACNAVTESHYTALVGTNMTWVKEKVKALCGKPMKAYLGGGGASITATNQIHPHEVYPDDIWIDGDLNPCTAADQSDCSEMIHHDESIILLATAQANFRFDKWVSSPNPCPCATQGDPTQNPCTVTYDQMGTYMAGISYDMADCRATFVYQGSSSSGGPP